MTKLTIYHDNADPRRTGWAFRATDADGLHYGGELDRTADLIIALNEFGAEPGSAAIADPDITTVEVVRALLTKQDCENLWRDARNNGDDSMAARCGEAVEGDTDALDDVAAAFAEVLDQRECWER